MSAAKSCAKASRERERGHGFRTGDERVRIGIAVVAAGEVAVEAVVDAIDIDFSALFIQQGHLIGARVVKIADRHIVPLVAVISAFVAQLS